MITHGQVALFCSRELNAEAYGNRTAYGGGFTWQRTDNSICVQAFWIIREVPAPIRLHLFGDTPEKTIGCLVLEVNAPESLRVAAQNMLHRVPIAFEYGSILEFGSDVEYIDDDFININEVMNI